MNNLKYILLLIILNNSLLFSNFLNEFNFVRFTQTNQIFQTSYNFYFDGKSIYTICKSENNNYNFLIRNETLNLNYKIKFPDEIEYKGFINFIVENDSLFFTDYSTFHAFKLDVENSVHLFSTELLIGSIQNIKKINDIVYLFGSKVTSSGFEKKMCTRVEKIKLRLGKQSTVTFPDPHAIGFSFFGPTKIMDMTSEVVAIADYDKYKVKLYNLDGELIDSINYDNPNWHDLNNEKIFDFGNQTKNTIKYLNYLRPFTARINLIHRIDFLGNKLLICWSEPTFKELEYKFHYDIWEKKKNKWTICKSISGFNKDNPVEFSNNSINLIPQNYLISDNYLLVFENYITIELFDKFTGKNYDEYSNGVNNFFKNNEVETSVIGLYEYK